MPVFIVEVGVALRRPPAVHEYRKVVVEAKDGLEAEMLAVMICYCTCVMPVESLVTDWPDA